MLALKYHPDKNKTDKACQQFQEIHEAYTYLSTHLNTEDQTLNYQDMKSPITQYLSAFLQVLFKTNEQRDIAEKICEIVYTKIGEKAMEKSLAFLKTVDRQTLKFVYTILYKYQEVLHIDPVFLTMINILLKNKFEKDERILLYPSLKDLFEANLYRLKIEENVFLVPLWHHELVYDNSDDAELTIECLPELPENMEIDENNNLHLTLKYELKQLWEMKYIDVYIEGVGSLYKYSVENLNIMPTQTRVICGLGIPCIDKKDIYNIGKRGDIYLHIFIE